MNTPTVAEIVTFRLLDGTDTNAFLAAAEAMTPYLRGTGAMISRTLSREEDGNWTEHVTWTSQDAAQAAAAAVMAHPDAQPFMQMIDGATVSMRHARIGLYLPPE